MKITRLLCVSMLIAVAGCDGEGVLRPPPTHVRVFNAAANYDSLAFLREGIVQVELAYSQGYVDAFDSGQYDFHIDYVPFGTGAATRAFSFSETLSPDLDYTFVTVASAGQLEALTFTAAELPDDATTPRITLIHAFDGLGALDVYMEPPGTVLGSVVPRGTISFASNALAFELSPATYRLYLTAAGDPSDVVFESADEPVAEGQDEVIVLSDPAGEGTADILVSRISSAPGSPAVRLDQAGLQSSLRVVHGIDDGLQRDIYLDDTMLPPLFPAQPFGVLSGYADVAPNQHSFIVTPVGNAGTEELSAAFSPLPWGRYTIVVAGDTNDGISAQIMLEDKRSITDRATLRVLNTAGLFGRIWVYLEAPTTDITNELPQVEMIAPGFTPRLPLVPGDYEITIQDATTEAILAGPELVTVNGGGVYGILLVNAAGGSTIDIVPFDDFVP